MKRLGILGGMGPLASAYFYQKLTKITKVKRDQDHIDVLLTSTASTPDRTDYILGRGESPLPKLIESAKLLETMGANYLVMPCNTSHYFYDYIVKEIDIPFINMVEETTRHIVSGQYDDKKVLLLSTEGTVKGKVYHDFFMAFNRDISTPSDHVRKEVSELIYTVKKGDLNKIDNYLGLLNDLSKEHVVILGCTELSVVKEYSQLGDVFIDPMEILAKKAIEYAGKESILSY